MFKDLRDLTLNQTTKIIKELINKMAEITFIPKIKGFEQFEIVYNTHFN